MSPVRGIDFDSEDPEFTEDDKSDIKVCYSLEEMANGSHIARDKTKNF
jgi:hypothetical protein